MIQRMDHINVVVSDIEQARVFFEKIGFEEIDSADLSGDTFAVATGLEDIEAKFVALALPGAQTKLELIQYIMPSGGIDPRIAQANQIGLRHIAFAVDDIQAEVGRMKANGIEFRSDIQTWEQSGKKIVYFYGPDGILLELAEYPDKNESPVNT
jgi:catechol 2,3-dioxygenase-like lactoylglutathione lyase family enzyme